MSLEGALRGYMPNDDEEELDEGDPEPTEPPEPAAASEAPAPPKRRRTRSPSPAAQTLGAPPVAPFQRKWENVDAHLLYAEIMNDMQAQGKAPSDFTCFVERTAPPGGGILPPFNCAAIAGGGADAFYAFMVEHYHSKWRGSATYLVRFTWTQTNRKITQGTLKLPPPEDIAQMGPPRAYGLQGSMNQTPYGGGGGGGGGYGVGYPAPQVSPGNSWGQPPWGPPPGFGAPQQGEPSGMSDLRSQVGYLSGQLQARERQIDEMISAIREGRAVPTPPPVPVGVAAPQSYAYPPPMQQSQQGMAVKAFNDAVGLLRSVGIQVGPTTGVAAPAVPGAPPATVSQGATGMVSEVTAGLKAIQTLKGLYGQLGELFGMGAVDATAEIVETEAAPTLPFDAIPIPDVQMGGHPVHYARNKATGKIDLEGIVLSNPGIAEKIFGLASELTKAGQGLMGVHPAPAGTELVDEIPASAAHVPPPPAPPNGAAGRPYPKL